MKTRIITLIATLAVAWALPAGAQALPHTFVSVTGSDANDCSRPTPCRTFARGVQQVDTRGEVIALDSGVFGRFTANKSLTVMAAPGVFAGVVSGINQTAITVTATAGDTVVLRGLTVRGPFNIPPFNSGISSGLGASLHIEDCSISGFSIGIAFPGIGSTPLFVKDTTIRACGSGVQTVATSASFDNCRLEANGTGWLVGAGSKATIRRSVATANGQALTAGGSGTELNIDDCTVSNNTEGISSGGAGTIVRVANTTVTGNSVGLSSLFGALLSRAPATNTVDGNTTNGAFTGTYTAK